MPGSAKLKVTGAKARKVASTKVGRYLLEFKIAILNWSKNK